MSPQDSRPAGARPALTVTAGGLRTSQSPPFTLPIRYMLLGILSYILFAVDLLTQLRAVQANDPGAASVVALTHALTLGALLAFVMGAVYQLSTVAFLIPVLGQKAARWNFWLYLVAFLGLWHAMQTWSSTGFLIFGSMAAIAIWVYCGIILWSLAKSRVPGPMRWFVVSAHAYLAVAVAVAVLLVLTDGNATPGLNPWMDSLIATHIILAVGGFFSFLLMGFSFKLFPMFTLSHGYAAWREKWTFGLAHIAVAALLAGVWLHTGWLMAVGALCGAGALGNHLWYLRSVMKKRMRKVLEPPIIGVVTAAALGMAALLAFTVLIALRQAQSDIQSVVSFYLWGCVTLTVMSYTYKIIPFLVWSERYGPRSGKEKVPLMSQLLPLKYSVPVFYAFAAGVAATSIAVPLRAVWAVAAGCGLVSAALIAFAVEVLYVINIRKVWREFLRAS